MRGLRTGPRRNEENTCVFTNFTGRIGTLTSAVESFELDKALSDLAGKDAGQGRELLRRSDAYARLAVEIEDARTDLVNWLLSRPGKRPERARDVQQTHAANPGPSDTDRRCQVRRLRDYFSAA